MDNGLVDKQNVDWTTKYGQQIDGQAKYGLNNKTWIMDRWMSKIWTMEQSMDNGQVDKQNMDWTTKYGQWIDGQAKYGLDNETWTMDRWMMDNAELLNTHAEPCGNLKNASVTLRKS